MLVYTCVFFLLQQMNLHIFNILLLRDENITVQKNRFYTSGDFKKHSDRLKSDLKPGKSCFLLTCGGRMSHLALCLQVWPQCVLSGYILSVTWCKQRTKYLFSFFSPKFQQTLFVVSVQLEDKRVFGKWKSSNKWS